MLVQWCCSLHRGELPFVQAMRPNCIVEANLSLSLSLSVCVGGACAHICGVMCDVEVRWIGLYITEYSSLQRSGACSGEDHQWPPVHIRLCHSHQHAACHQ